jgi:HEAT repeat protein
MNTEMILERVRSSDADTRQKVAADLVESFDTNDLPLLFELLGDRDWRVRKTVVDGLVGAPSQEVVAGLLESLRDGTNAGRRNSATEALMRVGKPAIPMLVENLRTEKDPDVCLSLVNLLGDLRDDEAFTLLAKILESEGDVNLASATATSLGRYRRPEAIATLRRALEREDPWLRFHVIEAMGEIGDRTALPSILPLYSEQSLRKPILEAIGRIADVGTVNFLLRIISEEERLNLMALRALVNIAEADKPRVMKDAERKMIQKKVRAAFPREKFDPLVEHLRSTPRREVRLFILKILGWSGDERAIGVLLEFLQNPDVAEVCAQALADFGSQATPAVLEALRNTDEDELVAMLLRIVHVISGREAVPAVLTFLDYDNPDIRRFAIETLGEIVDPTTIDYLLAKLDDPDVGCQQAAVNSISALVAAFPEVQEETLSRIRRLLASGSVPTKINSLSIFVNIQGEGYHDELLLASKSEDPQIRQKAVHLMGRFGEERFADQLVLSLADESTAVRLEAIQAIVRLKPREGLEPLLHALDDDDIWIRTAAAQALGEYREPAAVEHLKQQIAEDLPPVRIAAIEALGKFGDESIRDVLLASLREQDPEIQRAALLALSGVPGDDVLAILLEALRDDDWRRRAAAAAAIGHRADRRALAALHETLQRDDDSYVQQSVIEALDRLGDQSSFPYLLEALNNPAVIDEVSDIFVRHKKVYRDRLEQAWRTADSRKESVIAAILETMRTA